MKQPENNMIYFLRFSFLSLSLVLYVGCGNWFYPFIEHKTDESRMYQAKRHLEEGEYQSCLKMLNSLEGSSNESHFMSAKCHAGLCGLDFLKLAENLDQQEESRTLFETLLYYQKDFHDEQEPHCMESTQSILRLHKEARQRNTGHNLLMLYVNLAHIGGILSLLADKDNDGEVDKEKNKKWNPCNSSANPNVAVNKSYVALSHANLSLEALLTQNNEAGQGNWLNELQEICSSTTDINCIVTEEEKVKMEHRVFMRCLQGSREIGLLENRCFDEKLYEDPQSEICGFF